MEANKVIVFQNWGIGDMIMTTPMLSALRQQLPGANVVVIASSCYAAEVIEGSCLCDEVRVISPGKMGVFQLIRMFSGFRKEIFDVAIICTRIFPRLAQILRLFSGIKVIVGDSLPPRRWGYTHWCPVKTDLHRVESNINILRTIFPGAEVGKIYFHLDESSRLTGEKIWSRAGLDGLNVLGVHPGTGPQRFKRFPPEKFRILIQAFLNEFSHLLLYQFSLIRRSM
jgi:ADP-heptose:LPS heptosyltransferase